MRGAGSQCVVVDETMLLDGASEPDLRFASVAGGEVVAYTCRSPDKETQNEDTVAVVSYGPQASVLIVADGAGGLPAGKKASLAAVSTLVDALQASTDKTFLMRTTIMDGIEAANTAVMDLGNGSATTLTVITIEGLTVRAYQIGDSEAVITGQRGLVRAQTMAHSPTGFAVEAGFLDEREALHHEERHLVSNFIGTSDMRIDVGAAVSLRPRDTVLVASDGLTDNVHMHEINNLMRKGPLEKALDAIVNLALYRMKADSTNQPSKPDDLSIILFRKTVKTSSQR